MATPDVLRDLSDTLLTILRGGVPALMVDPTRIVLATPDDFGAYVNPERPALTLFLYRVAVNPQMRNERRRTLPDGRIRRQPLPLELCYLITAWAAISLNFLLPRIMPGSPIDALIAKFRGRLSPQAR